MAEPVEDERWGHIRGVLVTTLASLAGISAGVISSVMADVPDDAIGVVILGGAILIQFPLLRIGGVEVETFGVKDYLFIIFMTFCFWFMSWTILLSTGATILI